MIKTSQNIEFYFWTKFSLDKIFRRTKFSLPLKISSILSDIFLPDRVPSNSDRIQIFFIFLFFDVESVLKPMQWQTDGKCLI